MKYKLLLNCLPPTHLYMPSLGCEVLKNFIKKENNIDCEIIYWNHLFQENYSNTKENLFLPDTDLHAILPFLSILAENNFDNKIRERILFAMQGETPSLKALGGDHFKEKYTKMMDKTLEIIHNQLDNLLTDDVIIFGISAKFDAWIPGIVIAQEVKKRRPDVQCVLGGIEEINAAIALFQQYKVFDFLIWGEGEIPTSLLIDKLINNEINFENIPRLLHRHDNLNTIIKNAVNIENENSYYNLREYTEINFDDYFKYANNLNKIQIQLPIEISRACRWNKCNFCALSWGNTYRVQKFNNVITQIRNLYLKYKINSFFFVDNDIVGRNMKEFEIFLDQLIELSSDLAVDFDFHADILHLGFNKKIIKKLSLAGFKSIQIGYEGISDSMLKKLNKSTTFAENLLFIKFAQKYDIKITITGLIIGIPHEIEEDVFESTNNLHFLRFFLSKDQDKLQHRFAELMLFYETRFWEMLPETEREKFNMHPLNEFLSNDFLNNKYVKYSLLGQYRVPPLMVKWNSFMTISNHYEKSDYKYYLIENEGFINYMEYKDEQKIESLTFDQPEYWDVLKIANDEIISFTKLYQIINKRYNEISKERLLEIVNELEKNYLLYSSNDNSKIISVIDTDVA